MRGIGYDHFVVYAMTGCSGFVTVNRRWRTDHKAAGARDLLAQATMKKPEWYWCLDHETAEPEDSSCPPGRRLGPYPSRDAAEHWRERVEERNREWEEADRAWEEGPSD